MRSWILATFLGYLVGFVLAVIVAVGWESVGLPGVQFIIGLSMGAGVGLLQGRLVNRQIAAGWRWAGASAVGLAAPFAIWDALGFLDLGAGYMAPLCVIAGGLLAGLLQQRLLRGKFRNTASWALLSALGWALAAGMVAFNDQVLPHIPVISGTPWGALVFVVLILFGGILLGAVTGRAISRMAAST